MYSNYRQSAPGWSSFSLMIRVRSGTGDPMSIVPGIRAAVREVDPTAAVAAAAPMSDVIARSLGRPRFYFSLLGTFAAIAIVLAAAGLYGVLSYVVAQRTREIGIRIALGAEPRRIRGTIVRGGLVLALSGTAIGVVLTLGTGRMMRSMVTGVGVNDPLTLAGASLVLILVAVAACYIPAWRASRVDPLIALGSE
jgi:ABC-type antimicrobial peptide transport system permease subunit